MNLEAAPKKIAIVGAGIAGLASAHALLRSAAPGENGGPTSVDVHVYEAADRPGGNIRTERDGGFVCEWGPEGFLDNTPQTLDLARQAGLGEARVQADPLANKRFILRQGRLREVPLKPPRFLMSDLLPPRQRLRVVLEPLIPARRDEADESVYDFAARRIGHGAAGQLVDAMVSGVYAGDARRLSLQSAFPRMHAMERQYGGLVRAMIARQRQARRTGEKVGGPSGPRGTLTTFDGGMERMIKALVEAIGPGRVHLNQRAISVEKAESGFRIQFADGSAVQADAVVIASPAPSAADVVRSMSKPLAEQLALIEFASIAVVGLGYRRAEVGHPLDGFGFLIPRAEGLHSLGALWSSSTFANRAPDGRVLIRVMIGGATNPQAVEWDDARLLEICRSEIAPHLGIHAAPVWTRIFRFRQGIAQYNIGHARRLATIRQFLRETPGIFLTGTSYQGIAVNSACEAAPKLGRGVMEFLKSGAAGEQLF